MAVKIGAILPKEVIEPVTTRSEVNNASALIQYGPPGISADYQNLNAVMRRDFYLLVGMGK